MKVILVDAVDTFVLEGEGIYKPMHEMLEMYSNRKIILTNANDEQMVKFGLTDMPYEVFTLKHNPDKPDPIYFKTMLDHFGLKADEVVYFEHNPVHFRIWTARNLKNWCRKDFCFCRRAFGRK
ncbi:MAG: hypothetical protein AAB517_02095 [Patescibacteria group bacterium]|mgnify:CR=1 FL=1